jgi:hypothetical protein
MDPGDGGCASCPGWWPTLAGDEGAWCEWEATPLPIGNGTIKFATVSDFNGVQLNRNQPFPGGFGLIARNVDPDPSAAVVR